MPPNVPITLSGQSLGERHRHLNTLVQNTVSSNTEFDLIEVVPEQSTIDRLFKIDVAVKQKNVDYIIRTLQDDDVLYVSRALKAKWLLHQEIMNPKYLEETLFPKMVMPAITKFKHWLYINLKDPAICEDFYKYYKQDKFTYAVKFLKNCENKFILSEVPNILINLTSNNLKVLCEKFPGVAKIYYGSLDSNDDLKKRYLENEKEFYASIKSVLKSDPESFMNITEKYYHMDVFQRFNSNITDYIMLHQKQRFIAKPELYAAHLLHLPTVAKRLTVAECEDLVLRFARAQYLRSWFNYKAVEPLIKRLGPKERGDLKKKVFVDKELGELVEGWPYDPPQPPSIPSDHEWHVFHDHTFQPIPLILQVECFRSGMLKKRKYCGYACGEMMDDSCFLPKTELEKLFDEFRFMGFERTFYELQRRLGASRSAENRRDMFLVLVSKTGGKPESVRKLLGLLLKHVHEPPQIRAAITRSLVRRAAAWRLSEDDWSQLLEFSRGLGLDGANAEAECREGFHAAVIRQLLVGECDTKTGDAFLEKFSTLTEYSLKVEEKKRVADGLEKFLLDQAEKAEPKTAASLLGKYLDVVQEYKIPRTANSNLVETAVRLAKSEVKEEGDKTSWLETLLQRLYDMRIARRELFLLNLRFRKTQESFLNALRHDASVLDISLIVDKLNSKENFDVFTSKAALYFKEKDGVVEQVLCRIKEAIDKEPATGLARALAILSGRDIESEIRKLDSAGDNYKRMASALRANVHCARPTPDVLSWGWKSAGAKAIATRLYRGRAKEMQDNILNLALERRTSRIALQLSKKHIKIIPEVYTIVAAKRPNAAIRGALNHFHRKLESPEQIWDIIKPLILNGDFSSKERLRKILRNTIVPDTIRPNYCAVIYLSLDKVYNHMTDYVLRNISDLINKMDSDLIETVLLRMLEKPDGKLPEMVYPALFVKYILLCTTKEEQDAKMDKIGKPFLALIDEIWNNKDIDQYTKDSVIEQILESLKYSEVNFDTKYVSSLPVMEHVLTWMQTFLSLQNNNMDKYVFIHAVMLYFKACRQSVHFPQVFNDPKSKLTEGVETIGYIYGKYIAREVSELTSQYFETIVELYATALCKCFDSIFKYGDSRGRLVAKVIEGILAEGVKLQRRLAVYILKEYQYSIKESMFQSLVDVMEKDDDLKLFVYAYVISDYI